MKSDFLVAVTQLAAERSLPREIVLSAIEAALVSAYRKDSITAGQDISVKLDPGSGEISVYILKSVVDEVSDSQMEIQLQDALKLKPEAQIGDSIATDSFPHTAGRIAAQTAKQVVMQRLREAERELVFEEFSGKEGEVFAVNVQRIEPRQVIVDLGRAEAILPASEQSPYERYRPGMKLKVLLQAVDRSSKGPELIVSRADNQLVKRLFEMEVPEIYNGSVEIMTIAREPGSRSKVAVRAKQTGVDPVGSCVGLRGVRIQNIVNEVQGEKIDVVEWTKDPSRYIANALSPAQVFQVNLDDDSGSAVAVVPDRHLSLAIGKDGQNARLAAKLTGWNIDIRSDVEAAKDGKAAEEIADPEKADLELLGLPTRTLNVLKQAGVAKVGQVLEMAKDELLQIKGFGEKSHGELNSRLTALNLLPAVALPEQAEAEPATPVEEAEKPDVAEAPTADAEVVEAERPADEVAGEAAAEKPVEEASADGVPTEGQATPGTEMATVPLDIFEPEIKEQEAVPALEGSALRDVPEDVWSLRRGAPPEPGQIRFAEDIADLRGGVTASRTRSGGGGRKRKSGGRRRRR